MDEILELEEVDYKTPDEPVYSWEDRMTDALNALIKYVKTVEAERNS